MRWRHEKMNVHAARSSPESIIFRYLLFPSMGREQSKWSRGRVSPLDIPLSFSTRNTISSPLAVLCSPWSWRYRCPGTPGAYLAARWLSNEDLALFRDGVWWSEMGVDQSETSAQGAANRFFLSAPKHIKNRPLPLFHIFFFFFFTFHSPS